MCNDELIRVANFEIATHIWWRLESCNGAQPRALLHDTQLWPWVREQCLGEVALGLEAFWHGRWLRR
eukprot:5752537-Amphidinium_carterae.1